MRITPRRLKHRNLQEWLAYIERLRGQEIKLGLERVQAVYARLPRLSCPVITVGGTNGKGSTTALLEAFYHADGYRVGAYFSPHLIYYNERVRLLGEQVSDELLCDAFAKVEAARGDVALTYFEFGTLAALTLFAEAHLDVVILEVGLGGRLDAVNVVDPDVAVVVSVGTDHKEWLGADREAIGREKAGIFRAGRPAVIGFDVSESVPVCARQLGCQMKVAGQDFRYVARTDDWRYEDKKGARDLPYPALRGQYQLGNAACALAALDALPARPVSAGAIRRGLRDVSLAARFQTLPGSGPCVILDVAHNAEAAQVLAATLMERSVAGRTFAVVGMLRDKPIAETLSALLASFDGWFLASLEDARGADSVLLQSVLAGLGKTADGLYADPIGAYEAARKVAGPADRIVVFGSFKTVGAILQLEAAKRGGGGRDVV